MTQQRPLRVLALSPIPEEGAGCRFRIAQYVPYLQAHGYEVTIRSFYSPAFFRRVYRPGAYVRKALGFTGLAARQVVQLLDLKRFDLVFLYREVVPIGPPIIESMIAASGVPVVYDFDDAIFLRTASEANRFALFLKNPGRVATILRRSTRVVVGNAWLAEYASKYNREVTVIPTVVDTTRFVPRPAAPDGDSPRDLVVGWIGSPTTFPYLEALAPVLREVAAQHRFVLKVSGAGRPVNFPGVQVEEVPWSMANEVSLFNSCDVGVYPLPDDEWSKGKCGFKAIQCMACGVAVVASAVGVNTAIIDDGANGFLTRTPEEWVAKLGRLLSDAALRRQFAAAGRRRIEERYALNVTAPQLKAVFDSAVSAAAVGVRAEGQT